MPIFCDKCGYKNRDSAKFCKGCGGDVENTDNVSVNLQPGIMLDKRYEIKRLIKAGGMGAVYESLDHRFDKAPCAVKEMLSITTDPGELQYFIDSFKKEAKILLNLKHSSLPGIRDYFIENGRYYLVMDYVEGEDLNTILEHCGKNGVPQERVIQWSIEILDVLDYLHNQSPPIVYRDLKPANVMLNSKQKIMLIDFGLARTVNPGSQTIKTTIGTPAFSPQELFEGKPEPRTDLYCLGGTMHCLLTGVVPLGPYSFKPVRQLNPLVSKELEAIVMRALEMNSDNRYRNAGEMKEAIEKLSITGKQSNPATVLNNVSVSGLSQAQLATLPLNDKTREYHSNPTNFISENDLNITTGDNSSHPTRPIPDNYRPGNIIREERSYPSRPVSDDYRPSPQSILMSKNYPANPQSGLSNKAIKIYGAIAIVLILLCLVPFVLTGMLLTGYHVTPVKNITPVKSDPVSINTPITSNTTEVKPEMVQIKGGTFTMGDATVSAYGKKRSPYEVTLSDFHIGKYEVTNKEYAAFLNSAGNQTEEGTKWWFGAEEKSNEIYKAPSSKHFTVLSGYENYPVVWVSWDGAVAYCNWRSEQEGLEKCYGENNNRGNGDITKNGYRLPTEAEWEYACIGGSKTRYFWGDDVNMGKDYSWYDINSQNHVHEVGEKNPNPSGLFDMCGNVWEWCNDWYGEYPSGTVKNPTGPSERDEDFPNHRTTRGGCYANGANILLPTASLPHEIHRRDDGYAFGFRLAKTP